MRTKGAKDKKPRKNTPAQSDDNYIRNNWQSLTDKQIGQYLGLSADTVKKRRRRLGLTNEKKGRPIYKG